jgi:hypothetical protein
MNFFAPKAIAVMAGVMAVIVGGIYFGGYMRESNFLAAISKTTGNLFGQGVLSEQKPAFEISLSGNQRGSEVISDAESTKDKKTKSQPPSSPEDMNFFVPVPDGTQADVSDARSEVQAKDTELRTDESVSRQSSAGGQRESSSASAEAEKDIYCNFSLTERATSLVRINELAWMGSTASANDEWIEILNNTASAVSLSAWQIVSSDGKFRIALNTGEKIPAHGFYLLERTDDNSVPSITADKIYSGALANGGAWLKLFNEKCEVVDEVNGQSGFVALGGDVSQKKTLERNADGFGWHTSAAPDGTPKKENSSATVVISVPQADTVIVTASTSTADTTPLAPASTPLPTSTPAESTPTSSVPTTPAPSEIFINEVVAGTDGKSDNEFLELYNPSAEPVALTGWSIKKRSSTGSESSLMSASRLEGKSIPAHGYLLLGNDTGYIGSPPADISWAHSYTLAYTNNATILYNASGTKMSEMSWTELSAGQSFGRKNDGSYALLSASTPKAGNGE